MGWIALITALAAAGALALPSPGLFVALGLGVVGVATGLAGYRRRRDPGPARLAGAAAVTIAAVAFLLATARFILTLVALGKLESLF